MRVKFCGITKLEDAREAARLGAWAIGLNHHPAKPPLLPAGCGRGDRAELRRQLEVVGVFVNPTLDEVAAAAENESLTHGPAPRRRGPRLLPGGRRAAPAAR